MLKEVLLMGVKVRERMKGSGIYWIFIDHKGKRKAKKIGRNRQAANKAAKLIEAKLALGDLALLENDDTKTPTLENYVNGWEDSTGKHLGWLNTAGKLSLKHSTLTGYELILKKHIIPRFGSLKINKITSRLISDLVYSLFEQGLRSSTIRNIKNCLSSILRHAMKNDAYITSNSAVGVEIPKPEDEKPLRVPNPMTWKEKELLEKCYKQHYPRYYPLVLCGFRTGLRIGELIALKWEDIDFHNALMNVQRNVTRGKVTTPKNRSGRPVRMTQQLIKVLKAHRTNMKTQKLKRGWTETPEWVFHDTDGNFIAYSTFIRLVWNKAMEKSGLLKRTPHDMRHTYATLRLSKGDSLAEVSKEMGHGSTEITFRTYYKWLPKESRSNIDELDGNYEETTQLSATYPQP
jgi:integrase